MIFCCLFVLYDMMIYNVWHNSNHYGLWYFYPLVIEQFTIENDHRNREFFRARMVVFHSYIKVSRWYFVWYDLLCEVADKPAPGYKFKKIIHWSCQSLSRGHSQSTCVSQFQRGQSWTYLASVSPHIIYIIYSRRLVRSKPSSS